MTRQVRIHCAVYTRKSSEEGLEQAFNSLHAQREACEAYILSQRHEGWSAIDSAYDDGGYSGGSLERPALKALLSDIKAGKVDVVVVYKIDRLTRSLLDFAKIVEIFDAHKVSFVSVTQSFNTTTSMGRLTLNVLLSFAQFEREITGERIRDKFAASKKKGMWMGGNVPIGYAVKDRKLIIVEKEAETVRTIFSLYAELGSVRQVKAEVDRLKLKTKLHTSESGTTRGALPFHVGHLYTVLRSHLYRGQVHHKGHFFDGDHDAIIDQDLWDRVQAQLLSNAAVRRTGTSSKDPSLLAGLLFDGDGNRMTPTHTAKNGKKYRYYISNSLVTGTKQDRQLAPGKGLRLSAQEIESHVIKMLAQFLTDPQKVSAEFSSADTLPSATGEVIRRAQSFGHVLSAGRITDLYQLVRECINRVQVHDSSISVELNRKALEARLEMAIVEGSPQSEDPLDLTMPAELRRIGKEKRLIVAAHEPATNQDPNLIKAIVRAQSWFELLKSRHVESITDLAQREGMNRTYASRLVPLAFLAPDITESILDGRQPVDLSLDRLLALMPLPLKWDEQRKVLGFSPR